MKAAFLLLMSKGEKKKQVSKFLAKNKLSDSRLKEVVQPDKIF